MCTMPSSEPETRYLPSWVNATCVTLSLCSLNVFTCEPSERFQSLIVLSQLAVAMNSWSGEHVAMFTVLFAVARTVGWIAQWKEMIEDSGSKIGRPRQLYTGEKKRDYVPMSKR